MHCIITRILPLGEVFKYLKYNGYSMCQQVQLSKTHSAQVVYLYVLYDSENKQ